MAADGPERELEERLREVGDRLRTPPDAVDELLKLLDDLESLLLRVEQSPSDNLARALGPALSALSQKELLGHADIDVKVGVATCISEITRITAPDAPYDDDVMKDVFAGIVEAFEGLYDVDSRSYRRRVSILETVAKVRSCVVMLDLECDDMILDMFCHFFRAVSSNHPENVISSMETIMKLVIEESEDVHPQIASCLLQNVKIEERETLPPSFGLAEKVIGTSHEKLKPIFLQLLQDTSLNEYSKVVTEMCQENADAGEDDNINASQRDTADDGKQSERTVSDELPQEPSKLEQDVNCPEKGGTSAHSGVAPVVNGPVSGKPEESSELDSKENLKQPSKGGNGAAGDTSDTVKPKRGRPPGLKTLEKKAVGKSQASGSDSKKGDEVSGSARKSMKRPAKDGNKSSTKTGQGESLKKQQKGSLKQPKDETLSDEDTSEDLSLKEMVSPKSFTKVLGKSKGQLGGSSRSKRKRGQETEEAPRSRKNKGLDGTLVGARVKVWWPDDQMFYNGVVDSYDTTSKRHKIAYDDGDVEVLLLRDERWEFISEEQDNPDVASPTPRSRKGKGKLGQPVKEGKGETLKSGKELHGSDGGDLPKKKGRPKGVRSGNAMNDDSPVISSKSKGKTASKDVEETPKLSNNLKKEGGKKSRDNILRLSVKSKDDLSKASINFKDDSSNSGRKIKDGGSKITSKSKDEASSKGKDSKDESKSSEVTPRPGRKPKGASTVTAGDGSKTNGISEKRKLKEKEGDASEKEEHGSGKASTGKKRRRKVLS